VDRRPGAPLWMEERGAKPLWMPDETFCEEMSGVVRLAEGELWMEMSNTLEVLLKDVGLDAGRRRFLWPDAKPLNPQAICPAYPSAVSELSRR